MQFHMINPVDKESAVQNIHTFPSSRISRIIIITLFIMMVSTVPVHAFSQLSIPLGHRVYTVLQSAELRGLIPHLPSVRPYTASFVIRQLEMIEKTPLSTGEKREIASLISEFSEKEVSTEHMSDMFTTGSYQAYSSTHDVSIEVGATAETQATLLLDDIEQRDLRNAVRPYIKGDIKDILSFSMNAGLRVDKLNSYPFLDGEFSIPGEGFYMDFLAGGSGSDKIPMDQFYSGFDFHPEIALSLWDGFLDIRWGSVDRDWGVGTQNLMLSGQAAPFEGIEGQWNLADWLRINFITGSLGGFALPDGIDGNDAFFAQSLHSNEFNNNFSANRVEVDLPWNFTFGIYESVIWIKRFEIGYLNPFTILMLQQSTMGDSDNVLAGFDLQWRGDGVRVYGSMATTEMNSISPDTFFTWYRNIMGFQGGVDVDIPVGNFSKLTFQYTKLDPFFYTHYPLTAEQVLEGYEEISEVEYMEDLNDSDIIVSDDSDGSIYYRPVYSTSVIQTSYVNKGFSLGYPIYPNSDEFLVTSRIGISSSFNAYATLKYQRRSSQYGYRIDMSVNEKYRDMDGIELKDFTENLFEQTISLELGASKKFVAFPATLYGSYRIDAVTEKALNTDSEFAHYPVGDWSNLNFSHAVQLGVTIYQ